MQNVHSGPDGDPWAKNSSEDGIPYYVSGDGADTSWDHPMLGRILSMLEDCNRIEYAAYRAATKLRIIQKRLNWDSLTVYPVASILQHHALKPGEADTLITIGKVSAVISDIFAYIAWIGAQSNGFSFDLCADLTLNLFINIFDKKRRGQVRVLSVQTFLCLLCKDRPQGKLRYLFRQVSDHNNCCSRVKLATLLKEMCYIMEFLDEGWKFGLHTVGPAVESCFSLMCPRQSSVTGIGVGPMRRQISFGLTEEKYLQWMAQHPQNLVWLFINHRLADSELVVHTAQCRACRQTPIVGLCYVCLQCWNVQLCQTCFLLSNPVPGHKKSHQMEEHCAQLTYSERFSVAVNRLLSVMRLSRPCVKKAPNFLPLGSSQQVAGDLINVLTRSEDEASSRDGNPSPLPPPPPPPSGRPGSRGSRGDNHRNGRGSGGGAYAVGILAPSCSSRSSGVVVDQDMDARTPTSGNWFSQSPNLLPSASSSAASTHSSASPPLPLQIPVPGEESDANGEKRDEPNVGRRKSINLNILPVHQQELQSILWHFEEEQKQLKSVLGNLESKAVQRSGDDAKHELQTCSQELEAQLGRLRSVLKNYMRFSILATSVADTNGNNTSSGNGNETENIPERGERQRDADSPRSTAASSFFPYASASPTHNAPPSGETCRKPRHAPLESTAVSTPVERGAMPYSPIGQSTNPQRLESDNFCSPLAQQPGKVVFRVKKLPTSLQMRPGAPSDPVFNARPRAPDDFYGFPRQSEQEDRQLESQMNGLAIDELRAPLAEQETLGSIMCGYNTAGKQNNLGSAQFPAVSLGDISSHLLSLTHDMAIPTGSPSYLPYDQQAKRVSMINRELEGILRELDAVYPTMKPVTTEENIF